MRRLAAILLLALLPEIARADAFCRSPESIISGYDHSNIEADFFPLFGDPAQAVIGRIAFRVPGVSRDADAVLVVTQPGDDIAYAYLFKANCLAQSAWIRAGLIDDIIGGGI